VRITVAAGTRTDLLAVSGVVAALRGAGHEIRVIGPQVDQRSVGPELAAVLVAPHVTWEADEDAGRIRALAVEDLESAPPEVALVAGCSGTVTALANAARRRGIGVVQLEAGIRSFDATSSAEANRRALTSLATVHLAPTNTAASSLAAEGISPDRVRVVGNPRIDVLVTSRVGRVPLGERRGTLFAARAARTADRDRLDDLVRLLPWLAGAAGPVTLLLHARTKAWLEQAGLYEGVAALLGVRIAHSLPYDAVLRAVAASELLVTDAGELQEEASYFGVPTVVLRSSTSRTESVNARISALTGLAPGDVLEAVARLGDPRERARIDGLACLYGDGRTAGRVVEVLSEPDVRRQLVPDGQFASK
jgi:UDP-N-acetylglucosamine 2-epimerase (non-hydrolysing)